MTIITISRGLYCGGELLARQLGERLNYKVISREVIMEAAKKYGVSEKELLEGMKHPPGIWERFTHQKKNYILAVQAALADLVQNGYAIYHGYGGQFLLKGLPRVIKLRLIAPLEQRIEKAMEEGFTSVEARRQIESMDEERSKWVHKIYHAEWNNANLYDLVINTGQMSLDTAVDLVVHLVHKEDTSAIDDWTQDLKDFALEAKIRAELTFHSKFDVDAIQLQVLHNVVHLQGEYFDKQGTEIYSFVKKIEGVEAVIPDLEQQPITLMPVINVLEKKAADIMLAIDKYPVVQQWVTIREAFSSLRSSSVQLSDEQTIRPRFLLVLDEMKKLVGIVSRRDMLNGLIPRYGNVYKVSKRLESSSLLYSQFVHASSFPWDSFFSSSALENAEKPVKSIMAPIQGTVQMETDLSSVVSIMLEKKLDLIPVLKGDKIVGVILMTDVFDAVCQFIQEHGGGRGH